MTKRFCISLILKLNILKTKNDFKTEK